MNSKEYRSKLLEDVTSLANYMKKTFERMPEKKKMLVMKEFDIWFASVRRMHFDEEYLLGLDETHISDLAAQFLDDVMPGLTGVFLCRHRTCLNVARNVDWLDNSAR